MALRRATELDRGLDSTITRRDDGKYEIVVQLTPKKAVVYLTEDILANHLADSLISRGTRVYLARLLENGVPVGPVVALKDTWIDTDRMPEGQICRSVLGSISDAAAKAIFEALFLTSKHHGQVLFPIPGTANLLQADNHMLILRGQPFPFDAPKLDLKHRQMVNSHADPARGYPIAAPNDVNSKLVCRGPVCHYRIVYEQVGQPLYTCNDVGTYCRTLLDVCRGR